MAFNPNNWAVISESGVIPSQGLQDGSVTGAPGLYTYQSATETLATLAAANYFSPTANFLAVSDFINLVGSDGTAIYQVSSVTHDPLAVSLSLFVASGAVVGPASSTDTAIARWNGTTGKLLEDSGVLIDASNNLVTPGNITIQNAKKLILYNSGSTHFSSLSEGASAADKNYTLPLAAPAVNGYVLSATTAGVMSWIAPTAITWVAAAATPVTLAANTGYIITDASAVTLNMPATVAVGAVFAVVGNGAGGWVVQMNTGQVANLSATPTMSGGTLSSSNRYDCIEIICVVANTTFVVRSSMGTVVPG